MYKVILATDVQDDIDTILDYYDGLKHNGGFDFSLRLEDTFEQLEEFPLMFSKRIGFIRRAFIGNYPYYMYYQVHEKLQEVRVLAIIHNKRGIEYIKRRLKIP